MKKTWLVNLMLILSTFLIVAGCSNAAQNSSTNNKEGILKGQYITILTGGSSGVYFPLGGALAKLYQEKLGVVATSQSTAASSENATKLNQKKAEVGFLMGDTASDAYKGVDSFKDKDAQKNLRTIAALYPNYLQIVTTTKTGIKTLDDLKGKRVAVGAPGSGTEISARRVLGVYGISYSDIKADYLSFAEGIEGIKNGSIDAVVISSGIPNSGLLELATMEEIVILEISEDKVKEMQKKYPVFFSIKIPKGTYKGQDKDINTVAVNNVLMTHKDVPEETVYQLTKIMFENLDVLKNTHSAAKDISIEKATDNLPAPLHPGAKKYYEEISEE
jgi:uncharacterized protein